MKMKHALVLSSCILLHACGAKDGGDYESKSYAADEAPRSAPAPMQGAMKTEEAESKRDASLSEKASENTTEAPALAGKKLIKNAELRLRVEKPEDARKYVEGLLPKYQAYLGNENTHNTPSTRSIHLTLRVPARHFNALMKDILRQEGYVDFKRINVEDVTEEYVDIETRLKTKRAVEARYLDILKNAKTISDVLKVENELRVIREEIEAREGRLKYLNDQVGFSTIRLEIYQEIENPQEPGFSFWDKVGNAFGSGWEAFLSMLVFVLRLWPFWILAAGFIFLVRWLARRK